MTKDDVIALAREAGLFIPEAGIPENGALMRFAALVSAHACDACANVADLVAKEIDDTNGTATYIAAAIRSRT